ncbi:PadR family transcriptional regulator [SCandidatus Aminicenantes bacterium Aminicenantia_JdfR_composite]|jgi:PadR family transcriptional regulator PadR|nr:PadR family transcriptional regulator [SCandidatus Aminicenantes bacterium Aminicenantia_JdfR_composite]MCP2597322.1 PadR family transcriptional regulator [Candidatus Aminicenantes bacterium AC-335-G13]MCP2598430.1 PadR family transcriptional regulator [Candidatus Aminicenantes bacterium AC-335-L06]MCP2598447.1 PadR family transcriptional regulator [Candidatus Aminicenantes bacterium AC-335-L06]MCP2605708.1 PadR family transcriptional regulator [Candidatus Aminicenantes bacterium AC-335-O07]
MRFFRELKKGSTKLLILTVLEKKSMYGYQIAEEIKKLSKNYFDLADGTIYPALHDLEKKLYIKGEWKKFKGRERKYYSITEKGMKFLHQASKEWNIFVKKLSAFLPRKQEI